MALPVLYNFLPEDYRTIVPPADPTKKAILTSIVEAISEQDTKVVELATQARDQLFLNSATGKYLINLAAQSGFSIPQRSGLDQLSIGKLAMPVVNLPKQLLSTINTLTEIVYSANVLHPSFYSEAFEPFSLTDGDNLLFTTDQSTVEIVFKATSFGNISNVSASELAGYINGIEQSDIFADTFFDRGVNAKRLRISAKTFGNSATIRCSGGTSQNVLRFPSIKSMKNKTGTNWIVTKVASYNDFTVFTWDGIGVNPQTYLLDMGDVCAIRGIQDSSTANFSALNGTFSVVDCGSNYFTIKTVGLNSTSAILTQIGDYDIVFTSSTARTLYDNEQYAINYEPQVGLINMDIPPIPSIVSREIKGATHIHGASYQILNFTQTDLTVVAPNSLPSSGVFTLRSSQFDKSLQPKYYSYSGKSPVINGTQSLILDTTKGSSFPYFTESSAAPMKAIQDPFGATLDSNIYSISAPGIDLFMENTMEFNLAGVAFNRAPAVTSHNYYTASSIYLDPNQNSVEFIHNRGSKNLYLQFTDPISGQILYLSYNASPIDPLNRTVVSYGDPLKGKIVTASMIVCQSTFPVPTNEATLALSRSIASGTGSVTISHNMGTTNIMFMVLKDSDGSVVNAERLIVDANNIQFSYVNIIGGTYTFLFVNMDTPPVSGIDTNPLRYIQTGILMPASQTSVIVTHSQRTSSVMCEFRKSGGLISMLNGTEIEFLGVTTIDQDHLRIDYINLASDLTVDMFMAFDTKNTSTDSVDGGLILSDINTTHIVKRSVTKDRIIFEINNADGTPKKYTGAIISGFDIIAEKDINGNYDAYMKFSNSLSRQDARISDGSKISITDDGIKPQPFYFNQLRSRYVSVVSQSGDKIYLNTGIQAMPGPIVSGAKCRASAQFGGSGIFITVDPNSTWNASHYYQNIKLNLLTALQYPNEIVTSGPDIVDVPTKNYVGTYIYDITGIKTNFVIGGADGVATLLQTAQLASSPGLLVVDSLSGFSPSGGYLCINYGGSEIEGPIRYFSLISGAVNYIIIDSAYVFSKKHSVGTKVFNLRSVYRYLPSRNASDYPSYVTGSIEARNTFIGIIRTIIASGVLLNIEVQQPNVKFEDPGILIF
jgi:hypothetical protein